MDQMLKRSRYEAAEWASYWIVDPDEPSVTVWQLRDGSYELAGEVSGQELLMVERPFPLRIVPDLLLDENHVPAGLRARGPFDKLRARLRRAEGA